VAPGRRKEKSWDTVTSLGQIEVSSERQVTETPSDLRCKFIIESEVFNLQRLKAVENGAVPQEDKERTSHRFVTEQLFL